MHSSRGAGDPFAGAEVEAGSHSGPFDRAITKSARVRIPAVQNFLHEAVAPAAGHFGQYFRQNIRATLRPTAGQAGLRAILKAKAKLSSNRTPKNKTGEDMHAVKSTVLTVAMLATAPPSKTFPVSGATLTAAAMEAHHTFKQKRSDRAVPLAAPALDGK